MKPLEATITSKGQITLPVEIRRQWRLETGDSVEFFSDPSGRFFIRPLNESPTAFYEGLPKRARRHGMKSDDEAIATAVAERNRAARMRRKSA